MTTLLNILLMMPQQEGESQWSGFIMIGLVIVVFYFFIIRPQAKRQKELTNYRKNLAKGDKVVTTGGIYGKISEVKDDYIMVDAGEGVKLKIDKNAVVKDMADAQQQR